MQSNALYELLLGVGGALLIALLILALLPSRRRSLDEGGPRSTPSYWLLLGLSAAALVVVAGPLALVMIPMLIIARRWGLRSMAVTAFLAFVTAGVIAAWHPASTVSSSANAFGAPAQLASVVALAAVLTALVADAKSQGSPHQGTDLVHEEQR